MNTLSFEVDCTRRTASTIDWVVLAVGVVWFLSILILALLGRFEAAPGEKPVAILLAVILPVIVFAIGYFSIKVFRKWVLSLDIRSIILLHSWRMIGVGFVFLYFYGQLPAFFAFPAGIGDAIAAIGALFIGIALFKQETNVSRQWIFSWNTFGLLDFIIAVSMGVATRTDEILYSAGQVSSDIMGTLPLVLIPGFAVPFYIITHLIIYAQLKKK